MSPAFVMLLTLLAWWKVGHDPLQSYLDSSNGGSTVATVDPRLLAGAALGSTATVILVLALRLLLPAAHRQE